ncbi:uncharacterized protein BCN122_II0920 [Burkholderia cenocepacia]|nr:uncharacterized protein BCN122_II0920 [Burkholderia cenocepacia]
MHEIAGRRARSVRRRTGLPGCPAGAAAARRPAGRRSRPGRRRHRTPR